MMVLDASALVVGLTDVSSRGQDVRRRLVDSVSVHAPDLVNCEALSALGRLRRNGSLSITAYTQAVNAISNIALERRPTAPLVARIAELDGNVTAYDAAYVALAESLGCALLTANRRLANAPGPRCDFEVI